MFKSYNPYLYTVHMKKWIWLKMHPKNIQKIFPMFSFNLVHEFKMVYTVRASIDSLIDVVRPHWIPVHFQNLGQSLIPHVFPFNCTDFFLLIGSDWNPEGNYLVPNYEFWMPCSFLAQSLYFQCPTSEFHLSVSWWYSSLQFWRNEIWKLVNQHVMSLEWSIMNQGKLCKNAAITMIIHLIRVEIMGNTT